MAKCSYCSYEWEERTQHPKACPECKHRLKRIISFDKIEAGEVFKKIQPVTQPATAIMQPSIIEEVEEQPQPRPKKQVTF